MFQNYCLQITNYFLKINVGKVMSYLNIEKKDKQLAKLSKAARLTTCHESLKSEFVLGPSRLC